MLVNSGTGIQLKTLRVVCYCLLCYVRPSLIKVKNINNTANSSLYLHMSILGKITSKQLIADF